MINYIQERFEEFTTEQFGDAGIRYSCLHVPDDNDSIIVFLPKGSILGKGKDKEICTLIQELNKHANIRLMPYGSNSNVCGVFSNLDFNIITIKISEELYPVANNIGEIGWYKEVNSQIIPDFKRIFLTGDYNLNDLPQSDCIAIAKECIIRDFGDLDNDAELFTRLYCEDKHLQKILSDYADKRRFCRNNFIDQLIEAGYEEWI